MNNIKITRDETKRNKRFESLCAVSQMDLKAKLKRELNRTGRYVESGDGYLYCAGILPILITAHMDTVHKELPKEIVYKDGTISSPQGIGGDDRCGIYMAMEILKEIPCYVIFFEDEEIGGVGSDKFTKTELCKTLKSQMRYVIELDRKGNNDAVFYSCDNQEFTDFITEEFWKEDWGTFSDICYICPALDTAGVNLSCGYYKAHTTEEYVVLSEMETAIEEVKKLINRTTKENTFEYVESKGFSFGSYLRYGKHSSYDYGYDYGYGYGYGASEEWYWEIEFTREDGKTDIYGVYAATETEAIGNFVIDNPSRCFNDITDVYMLDDGSYGIAKGKDGD